jgi:hypothetical protein
VHHDRYALSLASVKEESSPVVTGSNSHDTTIRCVHRRSVKPSNLSLGQSRTIGADYDVSFEHVHKSVVRIGEILLELRARLQSNIHERDGNVVVRDSTHGSGSSAVHASFNSRLASHGHVLARDVLEPRRGPPLSLRQRQPQL